MELFSNTVPQEHSAWKVNGLVGFVKLQPLGELDDTSISTLPRLHLEPMDVWLIFSTRSIFAAAFLFVVMKTDCGMFLSQERSVGYRMFQSYGLKNLGDCGW